VAATFDSAFSDPDAASVSSEAQAVDAH